MSWYGRRTERNKLSMISKWHKNVYPNAVEYSVQDSFYNREVKSTKGLTDDEIKVSLEGDWHFSSDSNATFLAKSILKEKTDNICTPPPGRYTFRYTDDGEARLTSQELRREETTVRLHSGTYEAVVNDIKLFMNNKDIYSQIGAFYKLGLLLYGPPGNGKTTLINQILDSEFLKDSLIMLFSVVPDREFLKALALLPGHKVFVFEEVTDIVDRTALNLLLDFLDGHSSVANSIILATTNYPEKLPGNIVDRPSRFDKLYLFDSPTLEEQKLLMSQFLSREATDEELNTVKDLSIAYIKEACIMHRLKGMSVKSAVDELEKRKDEVKKDFMERNTIGF